MNASYKTIIQFKDIQIPVKLIKVSHNNSIELNQLCKDSKERVRYRKYCPSCNKEITNKDIVRGYKYNDTDFVILTNEDIDSIKTNQDKLLNILYFCKPKEINDILINKSYYLIPEMDSEIKYNLFRKAMLSNKVVGVAEITLGTKQELVVLIPNKDCIIATLLFYENEINKVSLTLNQKIDKDDLRHMKKLISENIKYFNWLTHYDKYQIKLRNLIISKIPK